MKRVIEHENYGVIVYEESAWTGKKTLTVNGVVAKKINKHTFKTENGDVFATHGSVLQGLTLKINDEPSFLVIKKTAWYEYIIGFLVGEVLLSYA